jgi:hypothetical protein
MQEAAMSTITLHDVAPATFKLMLRFMYTDAFPADGDLGDHPVTEKLQDLLAAADRYALDRLKLLCASKLWDSVSVDTVAATLACGIVRKYKRDNTFPVISISSPFALEWTASPLSPPPTFVPSPFLHRPLRRPSYPTAVSLV